MTNFDNDLASLWQSQTTATLNLEKVKTAYQLHTLKQRIYAFIDTMSIVAVLLLWVFYGDKFNENLMVKAFVVAASVAGVASVVYVSWLRRVALTGRLNRTENYAENLLKHLANSVKIARFTFHTTWVVCVITVLFLLAWLYLEPDTVDKIPFLIGFYIIFGAAFALWAKKRAMRFKRELARARTMLEEHLK